MEASPPGEIAEAAVLSALTKLGFTVLVPFGHSQPYDLVVHLPDGRFLRVQCKMGRDRGGYVVFNSCSTDHGRGRQDYRGLADLFGVYVPTLDQVCVVPVAKAPTRTTTLRLTEARNCQRLGVRPASDFEVATWAALVEVETSKAAA